MQLFKQVNERCGEVYTDLFLTWKYNGKIYAVRVRPVFGHDNDKLRSVAQLVPAQEPFEKYM